GLEFRRVLFRSPCLDLEPATLGVTREQTWCRHGDCNHSCARSWWRGPPMSDFMQTFLDLYAAIGYWALFFGVLLENAGLPLPGETALLIASYLASPEGGAKLNLWAVAGVAFIAAVIGDNTGYWLGRALARGGPERGRRVLFLAPARVPRAERYFARFGSATVFFGRFVALLRIAAGPAAGAAGMPWYRFVVANVAGAALWVGTITAIGYYFGAAWEAAQRWLG